LQRWPFDCGSVGSLPIYLSTRNLASSISPSGGTGATAPATSEAAQPHGRGRAERGPAAGCAHHRGPAGASLASRAAAAASRSARAVGAVATAARRLGSRSRADPPSRFARAANYAHSPDDAKTPTDRDVESDEAVSALYERWRRAFNKERDHAEMASGHSYLCRPLGRCCSCEDGGVGKLSFTHTRTQSLPIAFGYLPISSLLLCTACV